MSSFRNNGLVRSILSPDTQDAFADGADVALDTLTESEALEQVPVFGTVLKLVRASQSIRDQLFLSRLAHFLEEASKLGEEERNRFAEKFEDPEEADRFGASLLILVEKAEDLDKPEIFGRLLVACAKGYFDVTDLMRLCKMVNRAITEDFTYLQNMHRGIQQTENQDVEQGLYSAGFLRPKASNSTVFAGGKPVNTDAGYEVTQYGKWLIGLGLSESSTSSP